MLTSWDLCLRKGRVVISGSLSHSRTHTCTSIYIQTHKEREKERGKEKRRGILLDCGLGFQALENAIMLFNTKAELFVLETWDD